MKKKKGVLVILLTSVGLLLILCGFAFEMLNGKNEEKKNNNNNENIKEEQNEEQKEEENKENNVKELSLSEEEMKEIMKSYEDLFIYRSNLYKNDVYNISEMTDDEILGNGLMHIGRYISGSNCYTEYCSFTVENFNEALKEAGLEKNVNLDYFKNLLGSTEKELSFNDSEFGKSDEIPVGDSSHVYPIKMDGDTILFKNIGDGLTIGGAQPFAKTKYIKAEADDNFYYIYMKKAFGDCVFEDRIYSLLYDNYLREGEALEKFPTDNYTFSDVEPNYDLYPTYKFTFKKVGDKYFFQEMVTIK